jgi:poly(A) polymerase
VTSGDSELLGKQIAMHTNGKIFPLDASRGIYRVLWNQVGDDIAQIDITTLGHTIENDLSKRDLTIDSLAISLEHVNRKNPPEKWPILDLFGGKKDLLSKTIRAIRPEIYSDDPVRLLRTVRIASETNFSIEPATINYMRWNYNKIQNTSGERIRDEFLKILSGDNLERHLSILSSTGVLESIFPELTEGRDIDQPNEHYWDVYNHNLQCAVMAEYLLDDSRNFSIHPELAYVPYNDVIKDYFQLPSSDKHNRTTILRLAALLHDIGKPKTKQIDSNGKMRFLGHAEVGMELARNALERLRISNRGIETVCHMIKEHLRPSQLAPNGEMPSKKALYRYFRDLEDVAIDTLFLNMADYLAAKGPKINIYDWRVHCNQIRYILDKGSETNVTILNNNLISGHDLISTLGFKPGPHFKKILEYISEAQVEGIVITKNDALNLAKKKYIEYTTLGDIDVETKP